MPPRFHVSQVEQMPNFSHGLADIATALAGTELDRSDLLTAATRGAEHLVTLDAAGGPGFLIRRRIPDGDQTGEEGLSYGWCHGPTGTSLLFLAQHHAGVTDVAGVEPLMWHRRCLHSVRSSGLPTRVRPGFWDNDGRCCGIAGVGDVFLDSFHRSGAAEDLEFALRSADALVERAVRDGPRACWRFLDHQAADPVLPPQVGWMQGAAGIAAFLFRASRMAEDGVEATEVLRMDNWWSLATGQRTTLFSRGQ